MKTSRSGAAPRLVPPTRSLPAAQAQERSGGPSREELIRRRAFDLYERHGRVDGHALDDWLEAEAEVTHLVVDAPASLKRAGGRA
jgi:hypothetical protein